MFNLENLVRDNIKSLKPYSSARDEFAGKASIFLDANENSTGTPFVFPSPIRIELNYHRYPDPKQQQLKQSIGKLKSVDEECIFLGNGSDECIDIIYKSFCDPGRDNIIICPPTYGMYEVAANIFNVEVRQALLQENFQLNLTAIEKQTDENTKIIWICSPNNPTGITIDRASIFHLLLNFEGIVVLDEAYIDFSAEPSFLQFLKEYPNLIILQTFSKAWGLAALRIGMAFASPGIIAVMNKVKPPYNISTITQEYMLKALSAEKIKEESVAEIVKTRKQLADSIKRFPFVKQVYHSDTNFLLVKVDAAKKLYHYLLEAGIVVRDRSNLALCENCLRITIGTRYENKKLIEVLTKYLT